MQESAPSDYSSTARRLRRRLVHHPSALHASLLILKHQSDLGRARLEKVAADATPAHPVRAKRGELLTALVATEVDSRSAKLFSGLVRDAIEEGMLRYDRRQELLRTAGMLGINRFDASLLIASIQHHLGSSDATGDEESAGSPARSSPIAAIGAAVVLQGWIMYLAWKLLLS